ncbi:MAG: signal peptidase I [Lachnospiraceae bacterium]|nr:signal peptidase I [Lachnospiraceae bacterium]
MDKEDVKIPPIEFLREELVREEARYSFRKTLWNIAVLLTAAAAVTALVTTRLFVLIQINGSSMAPTLVNGEIIFLRQTKKVEPGDMIGFYYGGRILLKRVIGSGGDQIEIDSEGNVYVNGGMIDEPYLAEKSPGKCDLEFPCEVPEGMVFVLGDNRAISVDSRIRSIGCVEENQIVGKTAFRVWPPDRMGVMR